METFGAYLKRERELRGISLREVAQTTKISLHTLELLEAERFDEIGGEIFVRGFLRNSARYLGLNPEDVVLRYDEFRQKSRPDQDTSVRIDLPSLTSNRKLVMAGGVLLLFVTVIGLLTWGLSGVEPSDEQRVNTALTAFPVPVAPLPVAVTAPASVTTSTVVQAAAISLVIQATGTTYIKLWIDSALPIEREMQAGGEERFTANEKIEILAGNAGGISLILNGKPLSPLGPVGRVRRRVITEQGITTP